MKAVACTLISLTAFGMAAGVSPISKAVELLSGLEAKIIAEGKEAKKVYSEFSEFCDDRSKQLGFDIKTSKSEIAGLKASIAKETATTSALQGKLDELAASIASDEADLKSAAAVRAKESEDFSAEEKEVMDVIDVLSRAIGVLEREMQKGSASMLQLGNAGNVAKALTALVQASDISAQDGAKLTALVQQAQQADDTELGAPAAAVYEGHSGDIIEVLEGLLEKAQSQLADLRKKETANAHNFAMLKQSLEDSAKYAAKEPDEAKQGLSASGEKKATAKGDLAVTTKDLGIDVKALADLHQDCTAKAQDFEESVEDRAEELKALAAAKKVLAETTEGAEKIQYGLSQVSMLQLGSRVEPTARAAVRLLRDLSRRQHSSVLALLASRAAAAVRAGALQGEEPFAKVKALISDLIAKLESEATAEASHKAFCDKEMSEASDKKEEKSFEIEKLSTQIEEMASRSAKLKEEVAALQKSLSELTSAQAQMDKLRSAEHEDYVKGKADMEEGLEGVKMALKILRNYYGQAKSAHTGAGTSIVGLLEVVESDLAKSLAEMESAEEAALSAYTAESKENEIEKASKEKDVKYKAKEAAGLDKAAAETANSRSDVQAELDAVVEYLTSLKKQCIAKPETYAERKARREAELAGLKEALDVLEGEAALVQKGARRSLRAHHQSA